MASYHRSDEGAYLESRTRTYEVENYLYSLRPNATEQNLIENTKGKRLKKV